MEHYTTTANEIALFHHFKMVLDEMAFRNNITINFYNVFTRYLCYCFIKDDRTSKTIVFMPYMDNGHGEMFANAINILFGIGK